MKRHELIEKMSEGEGMVRSPADEGTALGGDPTWEAFARQADREAQRYYEALAQVIQTADEARRDERTDPVGRAYLTRILKRAKEALGKEFGLILREGSEIRMNMISRSLN